MLSPEDLDEINQPGNPKLNETVRQFLQRQKDLADEKEYPPGTVFRCIQCGDCCRYNYYHLNVEMKLLDPLYMLSANPHGYWVLSYDKQFRGFMPTWGDPEKPILSFNGTLPSQHIDFLIRTGRRHGYWILNKQTDEIVVYCPGPCVHLTADGLCGIYQNRPEICKAYSCRRFPFV